MQYVYHFKRPSMVGDVLYPLNELKQVYPETFDSHAKKYRGREALMKRRIPELNCLWNDTIHLSPINPQIILDKWTELGLKENQKQKKLKFPTYKIPIEDLDESKVVYFDPHLRPYGQFEFIKEQVRPFDKATYKELDAVTDLQIEIWQKDVKEGRQMFWFSHTTHVLYKGQIDVSNIELITCA